METMNIALPESMKHFVQERVSEGGYSSVSEYVRELIRVDQKRKIEERIDALLLEGLDSGEPSPSPGILGREETQADRTARQSRSARNDAARHASCPPPTATSTARRTIYAGSQPGNRLAFLRCRRRNLREPRPDACHGRAAGILQSSP